METQVRTPQMIFMQPQRLIVPLFQRPYVWNEENQWEPLWDDVVRVAERFLKNPYVKHQPHFLGAVVLQQTQNPIGLMQTRTVIDGQQRLTTLQLLLDALHAELLVSGAIAPAARLEVLVKNGEAFCSRSEDQFKVWPTNRDRPAFNAVMGASPPVDYQKVGHSSERMVKAHRFFSERARSWMSSEGAERTQARATALESSVRDLLQMVVIDLNADENAQEIFETLNARGAQLTAADLIKNFIFQRLLETGSDVEAEYDNRWREFETGFWESEVAVGRVRYPRISVFLNHWLVAQTAEEIVAREVFDRFKRYADHEAKLSMTALLERLHRAAKIYKDFVAGAGTTSGAVNRLALFSYRTGTLESEVVKPLLLCLLDPERLVISDQQVRKALDSVESWMVRRMLVRATTKNYNQVIAELVKLIEASGRAAAGDAVEQFLARQTSASRYWPDNAELENELTELLAYRRLGRGRLRMVLEAVEDHLRGWRGGEEGMGGERIARAKYAIEHIMPRKWMTHWPLDRGEIADHRDRIIHRLGNLTLVTTKLNSTLSNGPWLGVDGKREVLQQHDVLMLNRSFRLTPPESWSAKDIEVRNQALVAAILEIWPVPPGHKSGFASNMPKHEKKVQLADLLSAGALTPGMQLHPRHARYASNIGVLLPDGQIEIDERRFSRPSAAAVHLTGKPTNGWWFFLVDPQTRRTLRRVRREYLESLDLDLDDDDGNEDDDDEV